MVEKAETVPHPADWWSQMYGPLRQFGQRVAEFFAPNAEAAGTAEHYEISVELPGVADKDISVEIHDGRLSVTGEKRAEATESGKSYYFSERSYGRFKRVFRLPDDSDPEKVDAQHKDGVLIVKVGKRQPRVPQAKRIAIRAA